MNPGDAAKHILRDAWNGALPVDLRSVAARLGVILSSCEMDACVAISRDANNQSAILYNQKESTIRKRFFVAHALGHHALKHEGCPPDTSEMFSTQVNDPQERAANDFALALLMPESALRTLVESGRFRNTTELAQAFAVSPAALSSRLAALYPGYEL